jgi:hypothetical protein
VIPKVNWSQYLSTATPVRMRRAIGTYGSSSRIRRPNTYRGCLEPGTFVATVTIVRCGILVAMRIAHEIGANGSCRASEVTAAPPCASFLAFSVLTWACTAANRSTGSAMSTASSGSMSEIWLSRIPSSPAARTETGTRGTDGIMDRFFAAV